MIIRFPVTGANFKMAIPEFSTVVVLIIVAFRESYYTFGIILTVIFVLYFLLSKLDYYVPKTLVKNETGIFFHYLWSKKKLDPEEFLIYYEPVYFLHKNSDKRALVLYKKRSLILEWSFRNKVRLSVLDPTDPDLDLYIKDIELLCGHKVLKIGKNII